MFLTLKENLNMKIDQVMVGPFLKEKQDKQGKWTYIICNQIRKDYSQEIYKCPHT